MIATADGLRCACNGVGFYEVVVLDGVEDCTEEDGCTPFGCDRCMPSIVVPCPICGTYNPGPMAEA